MSHLNDPPQTCLESSDEIFRALEARKAAKLAEAQPKPPPSLPKGRVSSPPPAAPAPVAKPVKKPEPAVPEAVREHPTQRPPMALLCIFDDDNEDGEWVRIRSDRVVIGRTSGDIRIPQDGQISTEHAEIVREWTKDGFRFVLRDLDSRNGTYARASKSPLKHEDELIIGQGRYRFESTPPPAAMPTEPFLNHGGTQMPMPVPGGVRGVVAAALVEVTSAGPVARHPLTQAEYYLGRDASRCGIVRPDDPFVDAVHARLWRENGQWHIRNEKSVNGIWFRIRGGIALAQPCLFRLGEQRFQFRVVKA